MDWDSDLQYDEDSDIDLPPVVVDNIDSKLNQERGEKLDVERFARRLDVKSLKAAILALRARAAEFGQDEVAEADNANFEAEAKAKAKLIWINAKSIINRFYYGEQNPKLPKPVGTNAATRLMRTLIYFETNELERILFCSCYKEQLSILAACGLVDIHIETQMSKFNPRILEVIREENKSEDEINLVRECFEIVKHQDEILPEMYSKYFIRVWKNILNYDELIKEIEDKYQASQYFHNLDCSQEKRLKQAALLIKTVKRFKKVFGELNPRTVVLRGQEMIYVLTLDEFSNQVRLNEWEEVYGVYERFRLKNPEGSRLFVEMAAICGRTMYRIATSQNSDLNAPLKTKFLEESLRAYRINFCYHRNLNQLLKDSGTYKIYLDVLQCLKALKKSDTIVKVLKGIHGILIFREKENRCRCQFYLSLVYNFDFWSRMFEEILEYAGAAKREIILMTNFSAMLKFLFDFYVNVNSEYRYIINAYPDTDYNGTSTYVAIAYLKSLIAIQDFDQILIIAIESDKLWKEFEKSQLERGTKTRDRFETINEINNYFYFHQLLLTTAMENLRGNLELQKRILKESIEFSKEMVKIVFHTYEFYSYSSTYDFQNPGISHIIRCYMHIGRTGDLILYLDEYEELLLEMFGHDIHILATELLLLLKTIIKYIKLGHCTHKLYNLLDAVELKSKKCLDHIAEEVDGNEWMKSVLKEKAEKLILFCTKHKRKINSSLEVDVAPKWSKKRSFVDIN